MKDDSFRRFGGELEFELPAGTVVHILGHAHLLLAPVKVRSARPATVIEGLTLEGTPEHAAWPSAANVPEGEYGTIPVTYVRWEDLARAKGHYHRRVGTLRFSEKKMAAWLVERMAAQKANPDSYRPPESDLLMLAEFYGSLPTP